MTQNGMSNAKELDITTFILPLCIKVSNQIKRWNFSVL